ncbi:hypothetical protein V6N13_130063 [Hibiscus sabdariffa]|uniref:Uncharacterized protein n=1 Tax=Hibiscus sabdariffa TaxID=183260 RepID=A0ABR2SNL0_9ROSI
MQFMDTDTLGLGFFGAPEISSWPRLEQQGLPVDSDEQRVTKKVKNRGGSLDLSGDGSSEGLEHVSDAGDNGDVHMLEDGRDNGFRDVVDGPAENGEQQKPASRSYAAATAAGLLTSEGNGRPRSSMDDVEVLDDDVIVDDSV